MSRSRSCSKERRFRRTKKREERERYDSNRYRSSRHKNSKNHKERSRNRNTSRSNYISTHHRSRKIYNRQVTKSSSRDYKKNHFSSSSDSSTDHRFRKRSHQSRSNGKERKSSRFYSSSTSSSSSEKSSPVIASNHSLGSLVGLKQVSSAQMFSSSIITNYQQPIAVEQPLPPGVASESSLLIPSNNHQPPPPPPLSTNLTLTTPITMMMPPPFMSSMPPPSCIPVPSGKPPPICIPMPVPPPPPLPKVRIPVQQPPPLPGFKVTPFVIRPNSFYNPSLATPMCFAPFSEVPPPPPPFENSTVSSTSVTKTNNLKRNSIDTVQEVNEPSTSNASQSKSATLQLPYPNLPVLQKRDYEKPVILNKRKLPDVSENWGVGTLSNYKVINQVGEGTYGQVYKALKRSNGQVVALKKVRLENEREGFPITAVREIKILRQLDHKNVVKLYDIVTGPKDVNDKQQPLKKEAGAFYLVFEYVDHDLNGLLDSNIVEFSELQITSLFKQLILALEHCHNLNFLHRDLKCANILINNKGELKLADFGLARLYLKDVERLYTNRVITLWYRSPELLFGQERYGTEVDIWSAGCILGELFLKKPIFQGNAEQTQLEIISQICGSPSPENWPEVVNLPNYKVMRSKNHYPRRLKDKFSFLSVEAFDLLDRLLQLDPRRRPSADEALKHPWLINIEPDQISPPKLPHDQDCHEMWSKKRRRNNTRAVVSAENANSNTNFLNINAANTGISCNGNSHHQHLQKSRRRE